MSRNSFKPFWWSHKGREDRSLYCAQKEHGKYLRVCRPGVLINGGKRKQKTCILNTNGDFPWKLFFPLPAPQTLFSCFKVCQIKVMTGAARPSSAQQWPTHTISHVVCRSTAITDVVNNGEAAWNKPRSTKGDGERTAKRHHVNVPIDTAAAAYIHHRLANRIDCPVESKR